MEEKRRGPISFCRLTSAADQEYATRAARDLVRENLTLLHSVCVWQTTQSTEFQKLAGILTRQPRLGVSSTSDRRIVVWAGHAQPVVAEVEAFGLSDLWIGIQGDGFSEPRLTMIVAIVLARRRWNCFCHSELSR